MKRIEKILSVFLLFALVFVGITAPIACGDKDDNVYKNGVVKQVSGSVRVYRDGGSLPAYPGLQLRHGDNIRTEKESFVSIALDGDRYSVIEAESDVTLKMYVNQSEDLTDIYLNKGAVYTESETYGAEGLIYGVSTPDAKVVGGAASYRVSLSIGEPRVSLVQVMRGSAAVSTLGTVNESKTLTEGLECRVEHYLKQNGLDPFFAAVGEKTDKYSLPYRYIELGEEGVFDAEGNIIDRPLSGDLTLKGISVRNADGSSVSLVPEFDNDIPGYVAETSSPESLTVTVNHPKTQVRILCHTAFSVETVGKRSTVTFRNENGIVAHSVSILVIAEDGTEARFSVTVVPLSK